MIEEYRVDFLSLMPKGKIMEDKIYYFIIHLKENPKPAGIGGKKYYHRAAVYLVGYQEVI